MAKKQQVIVPGMPKHVSIDGGLGWTRKQTGMQGYSSDDGKFDILCGNGYCVLVSFDHDPIDDAEFWRKRFGTIKEAMKYAETM